ncbi:MAG: PQQ-dependent sugar dehydrogenase [Proteobacteria bacterium]|nr:PQQ-dependent sugar dehydrogenase [Pseudomonadota bacterium]
MRTRSLLLAVALALPATAGAAAPAADEEPCTPETGWTDCTPIKIKLEPLTAGDKAVTASTATAILFSPLTAGGPEHVIINDTDGEVVAYDLATGAATTLLKLEGVGSANPERGLLGLALHPNFPEDRRFFTYHLTPRTDEANRECDRMPPFNTKNRDAICAKGELYGCGGSFWVTEWTMGEDPASEPSKRVVLTRLQPGEGHNAGHLLFGPDGMLYLSLGDGGAQMDPCGRGQDHSKVYSSVLRMDVDAEGALAEGNPFIGQEGYDPLIFAYGFRNPWRMWFTATGELIVADTGQARYEEVNIAQAGGNYGWSVRDGTLNHPAKGEAPADDRHTAPLFQYGDGKGKSAPTGGFAIVGGVVQTGSAVPGLNGYYLFADNVSQKMWALDLSASDLTDPSSWNGSAKVHRLEGGKVAASTFGVDADGNVYVGGSGGKIFKVVAP